MRQAVVDAPRRRCARQAAPSPPDLPLRFNGGVSGSATTDTGERWLRAASAALRRGGHRVGGAREAVLEELAGSGGCCSAAELELRLRRSPRPVGDATVYRTLNLLGELGLVQPFDPGDRVMRFELVLPGGGHHHHAVCERCGATTAFEDDGLEAAIARVAEQTGYRIDAHDLVLRGACPACAAREREVSLAAARHAGGEAGGGIGDR